MPSTYPKVEEMEKEGTSQIVFKTSFLLLATAAIYWQDLTIVANEAWNSELSSHILAIPPLLVYIIYRIRKVITATTSNHLTISTHSSVIPIKDIIGALLCLISYLIKWHGSYTFHPLEYHIISLPIFVAGLILIIFNPQTLRTLLFPVAFLAFLMPPPFELAQRAGSTLSTISTQVAYIILKTIGLPVTLASIYMSPVIYLETQSGIEIPFAIDVACSGLYSLIGYAIFAVFIAYIARGALQKRLVILAMGLPLIYILNILRIILLIVIGYVSGPTLALNLFHLLGGWTLILIGTLIIFAVSEKVLKIQILKGESESCNHNRKNKNEAYCMDCGKILKTNTNKLSTRIDAIKTILVIAIIMSLFFIKAPAFTLTEGAAEVLIQQPARGQTASKILPQLKGHDVRFVYRDIEYEKITGQDASLIYQYLPDNPKEPIIWVGIEIGSTQGQFHDWEGCYIVSGEDLGGELYVTQLDLRDIHILDNPPISARYFAFQSKGSNETQVILYWYTRSLFQIGEELQKKWTKISIIQFTYNPDEYQTIESELLPVAKAIANYWQPIIYWTGISLTIAQNGPIMIMMSAGLLMSVLIISLYLETKKKTNAKFIYSQLSDPEDRNIIDSIKSLEKEVATETKIAQKYLDTTGKDIDNKKLCEKLDEAEKAKIIRRKIINLNDEPYLTWKSYF